VALDVTTGRPAWSFQTLQPADPPVLWQEKLPGGGQATPVIWRQDLQAGRG
jgi:glucose dehydrogenase